MKESSEKLNNTAVSLARSGNYDDAIACLKRAIAIERSNYLLWFNLGLTYRDSGDLEMGIEAMQAAHFCNPTNNDVIESLANMVFSAGDLQAALEICYEGLENAPQQASLWNLSGVILFNMDQLSDAADSFEHALSINPYDKNALFNLRDTYTELGNNIGAQECARRLNELD